MTKSSVIPSLNKSQFHRLSPRARPCAVSKSRLARRILGRRSPAHGAAAPRPIERAATAQTIIGGARFHILLRADLDERELSVSLYHEILEAATVAAESSPASVIEFNKGAFEHAAQKAHERFGVASPQSLNQLLAEYGF